MAIEELAEEVATNLEEVAEVTRRINTKAVGYFLGGVAVGAAIGFYWGYRWNREKIKAEVFKESEAEVEKIREIYQQKVMAATPKPSVEEVIEEKGYSIREVDERPTRPPVPVRDPRPATIPADIVAESIIGTWNYAEEMQNRDPEHPYVIHQDEFMEGTSGYSKVVYTYYAGDDVLCDESERPLPHADIIVGQDNLKFGYGTDDADVVFVRNQKLELEMEICRTHKSYEEEVLGLERNDSETT